MLAPCGVPGWPRRIAPRPRGSPDPSTAPRPPSCRVSAAPTTAPSPRRRREGRAASAAPRRSRTRPRAACRGARRRRRTAALRRRPATGADARRCPPRPRTAPGRTRFASRALRRPGRSRCAPAATVSAAATGVVGASDTSSWSWPYSVWICSTGSPARSAAAARSTRNAERSSEVRIPYGDHGSVDAWPASARQHRALELGADQRGQSLCAQGRFDAVSSSERVHSARGGALLVGEVTRRPGDAVVDHVAGRRDRCGSAGRRRRRCSG